MYARYLRKNNLVTFSGLSTPARSDQVMNERTPFS
jgi:hypothetical protein